MRAMTAADGFGFVRLHHVQLAIPSGGEEACRAFWRDALGMSELDKPPAALAGRCEAAGIEVEWDDGFPGFRRFHALDPHGSRLEFLEPVG
ncbi:MAG: hypothetical protein QG661_2024 [Actinomycetota bacterium]|nr:hypothetical protein [Actinomycetota bacterium]